MASHAAIAIEQRQLQEFTERANRLLQQVKWTPKTTPTNPAAAAGTPQWRDSTLATPQEEQVSLITIARQISRDPLLLSEDVNHVLNVLRRGIQIGAHLS